MSVGHSIVHTMQPVHRATCTGNTVIHAWAADGVLGRAKSASGPCVSGRVMSRQWTGQTSTQTPQLRHWDLSKEKRKVRMLASYFAAAGEAARRVVAAAYTPSTPVPRSAA